jgi:hypothetical protein
MASTAPQAGRKPFRHTKESQVGIEDDPSNPKKLRVSRDTFWVSKADVGDGDIAEWFCNRKHQHSKTCFSVIFDKKNGSPFDPPVEFYCDDNGYAYSTAINVDPGPTIYEYRIVAAGKNDLDPGGGVKG